MELKKPALELLSSYKAALLTGWSPDNTRPERAQEDLEKILFDPVDFVESFDRSGTKEDTITLPDGSKVPILPGFRLWMWDGEFCGSIGIRWQEGTPDLPNYVLGHIGYAVVPWKRGKGYAKSALAQILPHARHEGLPYVDLTTDPDNTASQKVIMANGGVLIREFMPPEAYGPKPKYLYRITL
jgi:predicted acetyltransferase